MSEERRNHIRFKRGSPGRIDLADGVTKRFCLVHDMSAGGARLTSVGHETLPDTFGLCLSPRDGQPLECRVTWRTARAVGVQFLNPLRSIGDIRQSERAKEEAEA